MKLIKTIGWFLWFKLQEIGKFVGIAVAAIVALAVALGLLYGLSAVVGFIAVKTIPFIKSFWVVCCSWSV